MVESKLHKEPLPLFFFFLFSFSFLFVFGVTVRVLNVTKCSCGKNFVSIEAQFKASFFSFSFLSDRFRGAQILLIN